MGLDPIATTGTAAWAWRPDVSEFDAGDAIPAALLFECSTVAGRVEGDQPTIRVAYAQDATAGFAAEGDAIDDTPPTMAEAVISTGKIAQLVQLSREQWRQPGTPAMLSQSIARSVTTAADIAFIKQAAPTAPATWPPAGLLNATGIVEGDPVSDSLDALVDLVATLEANGSKPSIILLSPQGWAELSKLKTAVDFNQTLLGAGVEAGIRRLLGIPVRVTHALTDTNGMIIDRTQVLSAVGDLVIAHSEHALFSRDSITVRATWRFGATVIRPDRIGTFSVTASTPKP